MLSFLFVEERWGGKRPAFSRPTHFLREKLWGRGCFSKKKQQQSRVFFDVIFHVYTHVDNRERLERVIENKRDEFCRKKNMKTQSGCETIRNASG